MKTKERRTEKAKREQGKWSKENIHRRSRSIPRMDYNNVLIDSLI